MSRLQTPIRRNDKVVVTTGQGQRQARAGAEGAAGEEPPDRRGREHHQAAHAAEPAEATSRAGSSSARASLHASNVQLVCPECGKMTRIGHRGAGRPQGPDLPQVRGSGRQMSRLKDRYQKEVAPALKKEFGYTNVMAIPQDREGRHQHGPRRGDAATPSWPTSAPTSSAASPARRRSSAARPSRSRSSSCARACRSARW